MTSSRAARTTPTVTPATGERADLLDTLTKHRALFRLTVAGLTDEQARLTPTVSTLSLGGLVKHLTWVERDWARFLVEGPREPSVPFAEIDWSDPPAEMLEFRASFTMEPADTLDALLAAYDGAAAAFDALVASVDLDVQTPLPAVPWFEPGASWSARRVATNLVAETAQHAGHADILRESIDGQRSMG